MKVVGYNEDSSSVIVSNFTWATATTPSSEALFWLSRMAIKTEDERAPRHMSMPPPDLRRHRTAADHFKGGGREKFCAAVAGATAGGVGVIVGQPFDMLKVQNPGKGGWMILFHKHTESEKADNTHRER